MASPPKLRHPQAGFRDPSLRVVVLTETLFFPLAPGIAAANVEITGTSVSATTLHNLFEFDGEYKTKLDFAKAQGKVAELTKMRVLLLDEISMIDILAWQSICNVLSILSDSQPGPDHLGAKHLLLFGDFKQLPPATSQAPFIIDPYVTRTFDFRMLAQNRRIVDDETRRKELDQFHEALTSISEGVPSDLVKRFLVDCYVRGARIAAETVDFEGSTAVFTKRRYRDKWNRTVLRRVSKRHNHSIKIKAKVRARGAHGSTRYVNQA